jgi:hypothetical protein
MQCGDEYAVELRGRRPEAGDGVHQFDVQREDRQLRGELRTVASGVQRVYEHAVDVRRWRRDARHVVHRVEQDVHRKHVRRKLRAGGDGV